MSETLNIDGSPAPRAWANSAASSLSRSRSSTTASLMSPAKRFGLCSNPGLEVAGQGEQEVLASGRLRLLGVSRRLGRMLRVATSSLPW